MNVHLDGGVATHATHAQHLHFGGTLSQALIAETIAKSATPLALGSDSSVKKKRNYQPAIVSDGKKSLLVHTNPMPGKHLSSLN